MAGTVVVTTRHGALRGLVEDGLAQFRGVRYARSPAADGRFRAPQPVAEWSGERSATAFGPVPHQMQISAGLLIPDEAHDLRAREDEDCLFLNVWTPDTAGSRPVMVYLHGGNFVEGAGSELWTDPTVLARDGDVVVVSVNYRLGALGWLFLDDLGGEQIQADSNVGLRDQMAALEWVRENIRAFGGDPANVTLFGYSAGSWSIAALLAMGAAPRLFDKAIAMSGGIRCHTREQATQLAADVLRELGITPGRLEPLRTVEPARLVEAMREVWNANGHPFPPVRPVADGTLIPLDPHAALAAGSATGVPLVAGSTRDEFRLVATIDEEAERLDEDGLVEHLAGQVGAETARAVVAAYTAARSARGESVTPADLFWAIESDRLFSVPTVHVAELQSSVDEDTWMYQVTWTAGDPRLGACHSVDLALLFGTLDIAGMDAFTGSGDATERLAAHIQRVWTAFARTGDPSVEGAEWPRYDTTSRSTMVLDDPVRVVDGPAAAERSVWERSLTI